MTRPLPGMPLVALRLVVLLLAGLWPSAAEPYSRSTTDTGNALFWTEREVTLNLVLPCLPDACYEAAAIEAAQAWTDAGARFTFHTTTQFADPCNHNDGLNTVTPWSTNVVCLIRLASSLGRWLGSGLPAKSLRLMLFLIAAWFGGSMRVHGAAPSLTPIGSPSMNLAMSWVSPTRTSMGRSCRPL